jgi:hypothetical protein
MACATTGATTNCTSLGVAPSATAFHTLKMRADGTIARKIWFSVNGGTEKSLCASGCDIAPSDQGWADLAAIPTMTAGTSAAAEKTVSLDFFGFEATVAR